MSNYTIFQRNVMHALAGAADDDTAYEDACAIYLATDNEALALEWCHLSSRLGPMLTHAVRVVTDDRSVKSERDPATVFAEVRAFIRDRHWHWRTHRQKTPFRAAA